MRTTVVAVLSLVVLAFVGCSSEPYHLDCAIEAKQYIKRQLEYPATFDEHQLDTSSARLDYSHVFGNKEEAGS